jgi:hypothetical protein
VEECWEEVVDKNSGQIYYWNTQTNETTALGAPRPSGPTALGPANPGQVAQQNVQYQQPGLGSVMAQVFVVKLCHLSLLIILGGAQGMAFGVGSSVAHSVFGSLFGGSSHSSGGGDSGGDVGGDIGGDDVFDL